jgi:hypothetical protein
LPTPASPRKVNTRLCPARTSASSRSSASHSLRRPSNPDAGGFLDRAEHLPGPQRDALGTVFGRSAGSPPDRFLVGLGVLGLLSEVAGERPLVCLVDDAQWLDRASAQALGFVARRLLAESVGMVFALREPSDGQEIAGLPELVVGGLGDDDARALLDSAIPGRLDERVRDRIVAETRGNPLALLELPRALTTAELAGGFELPDATPLDRGPCSADPIPGDASQATRGAGGRRRGALGWCGARADAHRKATKEAGRAPPVAACLGSTWQRQPWGAYYPRGAPT